MGSKQAKVSYTTRAAYRFPHSLHGRENKKHVTSVITTHTSPRAHPAALSWPTLVLLCEEGLTPGAPESPRSLLTTRALGSRSLKTPGEATLLSCPRTQGCATRTQPRTPPRAQSCCATHGPLCQPRGFSAQQHGRKPRHGDRLLALAGSLAVSGGQAESPDPSRSPNVQLL